MRRQIATTPEIDTLLAASVPVAIGVSGGKDSQAAALASVSYLDSIGHDGPRVLIHSDLGSVEWMESLPVCERLATHLGIELIVVRRAAGGLMERWRRRWDLSVQRYAALNTVTLVLPWSTPSMRFCTSEMKTHVITAELKRRFGRRMFVNVTGVRREESAARARGSIAALDSTGRFYSWRPISDWTVDDVFARIGQSGLSVHEAYSKFGLSRVSCRFCIYSALADLVAAAAVPETRGLYRQMVDLEIASTFAFQGVRWLGDVAPQLLDPAQVAGLVEAKKRAAVRVAAEAKITKEMLYVQGWPTRMLTDAEARVLASVRKIVSGTVGIVADCLTVKQIHSRYAELIAARSAGVAKDAA